MLTFVHLKRRLELIAKKKLSVAIAIQKKVVFKFFKESNLE